MALRTRFWIGMAAAAALSACGGGGGSSEEDPPPTSGLPDPGDIVNADPAYIAALEEYLALTRSPIFAGDPAGLPASGSATYTGVGRITDASVTSDDVTATALLNRSVVTDVTATVDFAGQSLTATQDNFRDVRNAAVSGSVEWNGNFNATDGAFNATVTGNVGGTQFSTGSDQAAVLFFGDAADSGLVGRFLDAPVSSSGTFEGTAISGDFAAESN